MKKVFYHYPSIVIWLSLLLVVGCAQQQNTPVVTAVPAPILVTPATPPIAQENNAAIPKEITKNQPPQPSVENKLNFEVENLTGKKIYVTCFTHIRRVVLGRWHWIKSSIYPIDIGKNTIINIPRITYEDDRKNIYGVLGVFSTQKEADDSIYELLDDAEKIDLDILDHLKGKKVTLNSAHYGFKKPFLEFELIEKNKIQKKKPEVDFYVHNNTNKTILICGFSYSKKAQKSLISATEKDDLESWRFNKTKILTLNPDDYGEIDIETITSDYDRQHTTGYIAIFKKSEEKLAQESTFELLEQRRIINIGNLHKFHHGIVEIDIKKYGILEDSIEFTTKPIKKNDMTKIVR